MTTRTIYSLKHTIIMHPVYQKRYWGCLLAAFLSLGSQAQTMPSLHPVVEYTTPEGNTLSGSYPGDLTLAEIQNAPLNGLFQACPMDAEGWNVSYDWVVYVDTVTGSQGNNFFELVHRWEENLDYDFVHKGQYKVCLKATFTDGNMTWNFPTEDMDSIIFRLSISSSKLLFPNTFTPNGDGQNDILKAKEFQSIVEFHAAVFNRWGQRMYQWDDVEEGWDGRWGGKYVRNGVYYLVVNAKGADGTKYRIKKAINVFTHKNEDFVDES